MANRFKNILGLVNQSETPVEQEFLRDLKWSIEQDDIKNGHKPSKSYKPSSMNCLRQMYYHRTGVEQDSNHPSYNFVGICNSGSDIHERVQKAVLNMIDNNIDCEYINVADFVQQRGLTHLTVKKKPNFKKGRFETKLYHKTLHMSFLCDGIIRYKGTYYILEIKTETNHKWYNRTGVDPSHYNQATAYCTAFGLHNVIFVYISRDMLDMKAYMFTPEGKQVDELVNKLTTCESYVKKKTVPPKPVDVLKKTCDYCEYKGICRKDG